MTIEEQNIVKLAFYEELDKIAGLTEFAAKLLPKILPKVEKLVGKSEYLSGATKAFKNKEGFKYLKSFAKPEIVKGSNGRFFKIKDPKASFTKRVIGGTARELEFLSKGLSSKNSFFSNAQQLGKNLTDDISRQLVNARYKTLDAKNIRKFYKKDGKMFIEYKKDIKVPFTKKKFRIKGGAREVLGVTEEGKPIIKKRKLSQVGAVAGTPVGMAAISTASGKPKEGAEDFIKWKTPIGGLEMVYDLAKPKKFNVN